MEQQSRRIGAYEVSILHDGIFEAPLDVLIHAGGQAARDDAVARWSQPKVRIPVNCFALKSADGITLVDAGTGPSGARRWVTRRPPWRLRGSHPTKSRAS